MIGFYLLLCINRNPAPWIFVFLFFLSKASQLWRVIDIKPTASNPQETILHMTLLISSPKKATLHHYHHQPTTIACIVYSSSLYASCPFPLSALLASSPLLSLCSTSISLKSTSHRFPSLWATALIFICLQSQSR